MKPRALPEPPAWSLGDKAWIYGVDHRNNTPARGVVIAVLKLAGWAHPQYVIELPSPVDSILEIRDGFTMHRRKPKF